MRKLLALSPALFLLCACSAFRRGGSVPSRELAVTFQSRVYALSKTPDPDFEMTFPDLAARSQASVSRMVDVPPDAGFGYTLAPKGAVYPFSEVEVACVIREKYAARYGKDICSAFLTDLAKRVAEMVKDR